MKRRTFCKALLASGVAATMPAGRALAAALASMQEVIADWTARVEPGTLLGELDRESQFFGLATPAGTVSHTDKVQGFTGGFYSNLTDVSERAIRTNWGGNYERLVGLKNRYDATNLFRLNANIKPTV